MEPNKISYYRKKMGLTQEELAGKINISRSSIAQYENGARNPNEETLEKMSELFNCFTSELKTKKYYIKETISFLLSIFMGIVSLLILISFIFIDDLFPKISMIYYPYVVPIMIFVVYGLMTLIICISKIEIGKKVISIGILTFLSVVIFISIGLSSLNGLNIIERFLTAVILFTLMFSFLTYSCYSIYSYYVCLKEYGVISLNYKYFNIALNLINGSLLIFVLIFCITSRLENHFYELYIENINENNISFITFFGCIIVFQIVLNVLLWSQKFESLRKIMYLLSIGLFIVITVMFISLPKYFELPFIPSTY